MVTNMKVDLKGTPVGTIRGATIAYVNNERVLRPLKERTIKDDTVIFHNNNENNNMMQINLSIFCHILEQSALVNESGEQLEHLTLNCPRFKVVDAGADFEAEQEGYDDSGEEVERDTVLLSAALLSMPDRYRPNFDGHRIEIDQLPGKMIEVRVYDKESKSGYEHLGMTAEFLRTTITIAYVEDE